MVNIPLRPSTLRSYFEGPAKQLESRIKLAVLVSLNVVRPYILLTANLDDFHAIAKQIAESPLGAQVQQILRRASDIFNENVSRPKQRAVEDEKVGSLEAWVPDKQVNENATDNDSNLSEKDEEYLKGNKADDERRTDNDVVSLGKNASFYLNSLKKIFETV